MCNGAKEYGSDRSRKMLKNEYLLAKFGVDTEENELSKVTYLPPSPLSIKDLCVLHERRDELALLGPAVLGLEPLGARAEELVERGEAEVPPALLGLSC